MKSIVWIALAIAACGCSKSQPAKTDSAQTFAAQHDLDKLIDPRLRVHRPAAPVPNGWDDYLKAGDLAHLSKSEADLLLRVTRSGTVSPQDTAKVKKLLQVQARTLALIVKGNAKECLPPLGQEETLEDKQLIRLRRIPRLMVAKAYIQADSNQPDEAAATLIEGFRLADRMMDSKTSELHWLSGLGAYKQFARAAILLTANGQLKSQYDRLLSVVTAPNSSGKYLVDSLPGAFEASVVRPFVRIGGPLKISAIKNAPDASPEQITEETVAKILDVHPHPYDLDDTIQEGSKFEVQLIESLDKPYQGQDFMQKKLSELSNPWPQEFIDLNVERGFRPHQISELRKAFEGVTNPYGRLLLAALFSDEKMYILEYEYRTTADATRSILQMERLREQGRPVTNLASLNLSPTPMDWFSGQPFKFDAKRHLLWSVGKDGKDDRGKSKLFTSLAPDLVFPTPGYMPTR